MATLFAPIHLREALAAGAGSLTDAWHGSSRLGVPVLPARHGVWSYGIRKAVPALFDRDDADTVVFGVMTGLDQPQLEANLPTPWMGLWERIDIFATMLWIAVLAIALTRPSKTAPR